jgi:hypothetical protein
MAPNLPKMSYISSGVILKGRFLTKTILPTSGGSLAFALLPPGAPPPAAIAAIFVRCLQWRAFFAFPLSSAFSILFPAAET